jgi:hypothetical protein
MAINRVVNKRYLLGLLLQNGFLVLIIRTTKEAESTDSINHPVLKSTASALKRNKSTPKVA